VLVRALAVAQARQNRQNWEQAEVESDEEEGSWLNYDKY
jgi:hypothetical protein